MKKKVDSSLTEKTNYTDYIKFCIEIILNAYKTPSGIAQRGINLLMLAGFSYPSNLRLYETDYPEEYYQYKFRGAKFETDQIGQINQSELEFLGLLPQKKIIYDLLLTGAELNFKKIKLSANDTFRSLTYFKIRLTNIDDLPTHKTCLKLRELIFHSNIPLTPVQNEFMQDGQFNLAKYMRYIEDPVQGQIFFPFFHDGRFESYTVKYNSSKEQTFSLVDLSILFPSLKLDLCFLRFLSLLSNCEISLDTFYNDERTQAGIRKERINIKKNDI